MKVTQAREAAREWVNEEASSIPGFCGAYTIGSTNWLPDDADLKTTGDLDVMVVLADRECARKRGKFVYGSTLLDVSYLDADQLRSAEVVLSDYHLAPSLRTANIILDPSGHLTALTATVSRDYAKRRWVHRRCLNARDKVVRYLRSMEEESLLHDQVIACLFAAGITTHILLVAGLRNPTVRTRYVAVRELLLDYGHLEFHDALLELLGCVRISRGRVYEHLAMLTQIFDAAKQVSAVPFPFASDISDSARAIAIEGSLDLIERGYYREAMFWIAVTHSRCQKILRCHQSGEMNRGFSHSYGELVSDLGVSSFDEIRRRCTEIEQTLPGVWAVAEDIMRKNLEIEGD